MAKAYINDGIIGNSRMLGCLNKEGELQRLFWPNIDHMQCIDQFEIGVKLGSRDGVFLTEKVFTKTQEYYKGTNILQTTYTSQILGLKILQKDFCVDDQDIMIRYYEIENLTDSAYDLKWLLYSSMITSTPHLTGTLFDFEHEALVHYQRDYYMSVSAEIPTDSFQVGGEAVKSLCRDELLSSDSVLMVPNGALTWNVGWLEAKGKLRLTLQLCFAHSYQELKNRLNIIRKVDGEKLFQDCCKYWQEYLKQCNPHTTGNSLYDALYERTLLVFKLMYDESSGGLMAAPEADEAMQMCGRYSYCWGRDAAFIADALDLCGLHEEVDHFFDFAAATQEEDGSWFQRYCLDGNLAPAWGLQVDETGALLYGIWKHYQRTGNLEFLKKLWKNVKLGAQFLADFTDPETGLPKPSRDLWEERWGEHTYSAASVHAGLTSSAAIAECIGAPEEFKHMWLQAADKLKTAMIRELWDEKQGCFLRGIRTQLYPEAKMEGQECMLLQANSKGTMHKVVCKDRVVDISLIGLSVPFGVFDYRDKRVIASVQKIEELLTSDKVGGIRRYEDDEYMGGNPWILTTLWLALYYTEIGEFEKALKYFDWAVKGRTQLNLLPEQVSKETGEPAWIVPLTWSHAMYVLVYHVLRREKII